MGQLTVARMATRQIALWQCSQCILVIFEFGRLGDGLRDVRRGERGA
jgi:hypothetical protein